MARAAVDHEHRGAPGARGRAGAQDAHALFAKGGRALFDVVSRERPDLPFLFCSGFPAGTIARDLLAAPHRALLPKPFSEDALLRELARLLEAARRPNA